MRFHLDSRQLKDYVVPSQLIHIHHKDIQYLANTLWAEHKGGTPFIKAAFEWVRDSIAHSCDIGQHAVPVSAVDVMEQGHGLCVSKSILLAAILRAKSIPCGF